MERPTIFLSSTVFDFADLRSALKDYLELKGCRVQASEFTDFERPLDAHSYDACLKAIEQADLFVLLIGRRTGGMFDEPNQISITRAEFRHAYALAQQGRIKILCFVRSDVWDHRQSVRDLEKSLQKDHTLSDERREELVYHPSIAMDKPKPIISFIDEVARNAETAAAAKAMGKPPLANWIWPFATFTQIRQAIDPLILNGLSVAGASGRKALEEQLYLLLQKVLPRLRDGAIDPVNLVLNLRKTLSLKTDVLRDRVAIEEHTWNRFVSGPAYLAMPR